MSRQVTFVLFVVCLLNLCVAFNTNKHITSSSKLFGSNHLGRYGAFIDTLDRPRDKSKDELYEKLRLPTQFNDKNGADLRKERTRNLKVYKEQNPYDVVKTPLKPLNFEQETINQIISTLNLTLEGRAREELTSEQRVGVVDWTIFHNLAMIEIDGFEEDEKTQKKLVSWVQYHIRKKDIVFEGTAWKWDATRIKRYGKCIKKIVPRKVQN